MPQGIDQITYIPSELRLRAVVPLPSSTAIKLGLGFLAAGLATTFLATLMRFAAASLPP